MRVVVVMNEFVLAGFIMMVGLSVAYWTGRLQGLIPDGAGTALAWSDTGEACP